MRGPIRPLIALAEDNEELRVLLAAGLERVGYAVVQAENGADLVEKVRQIAPSAYERSDLALLVTDVRMPVLDGVSAIRMLREQGIAVPVILMSAYGDERVRSTTESLNARWIDKPVGVVELRDVVAELLGRERLAPM